MSFDSRRPRNIYIGPRPRSAAAEYVILLHMDFFAYTEEGCDVYVNILKNRFNGRTGRHPRAVVYQWANQLNEPFDIEQEIF